MRSYFTEIYKRLDTLHSQILQELESLPQEALDWVPGPEMNSVCAIVTHTVGSERYWIGDVIMRDPSNRDRDAEFLAQGFDQSELESRLATSLSFIEKALATLNLEDLESPRTSPSDGHQTTVGWALTLVLQHTAVHLGHIQITRQLWEQGHLALND